MLQIHAQVPPGLPGCLDHLFCTIPPSLQIPSTLADKVPNKLVYFDVVSYQPRLLREPPYELHVRSEAPFLGDKVGAWRGRLHPSCTPVPQPRLRGRGEVDVAVPAAFFRHAAAGPVRHASPALAALPPQGRFASRIRIEPLGPDRCRHVLEQTIE